jgi:hypothetical protein
VPNYPKNVVQHHLELKATQLHEEAETLPQGDEREALMHRAIRMEAASLIIERWASAPSFKSAR